MKKRSAKDGGGGGAAKKTNPFKVVYISNPVRITTSAATFRGLVQQLTGRDSLLAAGTARSASEFHSASGPDIHAPSPAPPSSLFADREGLDGMVNVLPFETARFDARQLEDASGDWCTPPVVLYDHLDGGLGSTDEA